MAADRLALVLDAVISAAAGLAMWAGLDHVGAGPAHPAIFCAVSLPLGMALRWAMAEVFS